MLEDVFITSADQVRPGQHVGIKSASVTVGTGVMDWAEDTRMEISDVDLTKCSASALTVGPVVLRNCQAQDSKTARHFACFYGTAFSNCTLQGNCGRVWIEDASKLTMSFRQVHEAILAANEAFYRDVEVAIDLSDAWFSDLVIWGVPLEKVRTDPDRQLKCDYSRTDSFLGGLSSAPDSHPVGLLSAYRDRCRENGSEEFLIASAKSGKARVRFEQVKAVCEENGLLI